MRRVIIAGNWKMYKTPQEGVEMVNDFLPLVKNAKCEAILFPSFLTYDAVKQATNGSNVAVGVQNMHWETEGAFTGEVSPAMLKSMDCEWVIIGHSERRQYFGETDETVNKKLLSALTNNINFILCVGESLVTRENGNAKGFVGDQVKAAVEGFSTDQALKLIVAYEPIWAIGTGKTASKEDAQDMCKHIRLALATEFSEEVAQKISILYGGSVKGDNISELMNQGDIDGALVGGASLQADSFAKIVNY